jgi:hypothetical protein
MTGKDNRGNVTKPQLHQSSYSLAVLAWRRSRGPLQVKGAGVGSLRIEKVGMGREALEELQRDRRGSR